MAFITLHEVGGNLVITQIGMLPETFEAVQGGEAGLCVARPSCAPQHQAVAEHEFKNLHKKSRVRSKIPDAAICL